jgi:hypothetical protein
MYNYSRIHHSVYCQRIYCMQLENIYGNLL